MGGTGVNTLRRGTVFSLALYLVVLLGAPFEHHDLACHLKTPQHCTSCVASPAGAASPAPVTFGASPLAEVGRALVSLPDAAVGEPIGPTAGRSPPACS
jgi:hypothetical protein